MRLAIVIVVVLVGCGSNGSSSSGFEIDGIVDGAGAPALGQVIVLWDLGDTGFKFGDGDATSSTFTLTLPSDPPAGAITPAGIAVGYPVLVADGTVVPDGPIDFKTLAHLGIAIDYAVIWKDPTGAGFGSWDTAFGPRYSCGKCVRATIGHDSFELTACAAFTIEVAGIAVCNWT